MLAATLALGLPAAFRTGPPTQSLRSAPSAFTLPVDAYTGLGPAAPLLLLPLLLGTMLGSVVGARRARRKPAFKSVDLCKAVLRIECEESVSVLFVAVSAPSGCVPPRIDVKRTPTLLVMLRAATGAAAAALGPNCGAATGTPRASAAVRRPSIRCAYTASRCASRCAAPCVAPLATLGAAALVLTNVRAAVATAPAAAPVRGERGAADATCRDPLLAGSAVAVTATAPEVGDTDEECNRATFAATAVATVSLCTETESVVTRGRDGIARVSVAPDATLVSFMRWAGDSD